jgi:hypothetical protein
MKKDMADNRRNFLKKAGGVSALIAAAPFGTVLSESGAQLGVAEATGLLGGSTFALELEGKAAGALVASEGGTPVAAVVEEATIPGQFTKKHLGPIRYEPIRIQCDADLDRAVLSWLVESLTPGKPVLKDGTIKIADFNGNVVSQRNFFEALISEVRFPAMDAASRDPAPLEIRILPQSTAHGCGSPAISGSASEPSRQPV